MFQTQELSHTLHRPAPQFPLAVAMLEFPLVWTVLILDIGGGIMVV